MYLKAISNRKRNGYAKRGLSITLAVLLCLILFLIGIYVYESLVFQKSLPDPSLATEVRLYHTPRGSVVFRCGEDSIVSLGKGAEYSDYLACAGGNVSVLFLTDASETTFDNLQEVFYYGSVGTIYVPKGASKEFVRRLEKKYGDKTKIVRLKNKGKKFVLGEMVVRIFDVNSNAIAFTVTHGYDNFLVAQEGHDLKILKDTSFAAAFAPLEAVNELENIDCFICKVPKDGVEPSVEDVADICKRFGVAGSRLISGFRTNNGFDFDTHFILTGKLE